MQSYVRGDWRKQQRLKRGGGLVTFSLDEPLAEHLYGREPADLNTPESLYHRRWALALLERTVFGLRADYEQ